MKTSYTICVTDYYDLSGLYSHEKARDSWVAYHKEDRPQIKYWSNEQIEAAILAEDAEFDANGLYWQNDHLYI